MLTQPLNSTSITIDRSQGQLCRVLLAGNYIGCFRAVDKSYIYNGQVFSTVEQATARVVTSYTLNTSKWIISELN